MGINEKLKIEVDLPDGTTYTLSRIWQNAINISIEKHSDSQTKRAVISSNIIFCGIDFATLYAIETSGERCEKIPIRLINKRTGNPLPCPGYIALNKANINANDCQISAKVTPDDLITCYDDSKETELNFLLTPNPVTASGVVGTVSRFQTGFVTCSFLPPTIPADVTQSIFDSSPLAGQLGWRPLVIEGRNIVQNPAPAQWTGEFRILFARETTTSGTPPPGIGWTNVSGSNWVREPRVVEVFDELTNLVFTGGNYYQHWKIIAEQPIDNGRRLIDVLGFFNPCGLPIASDFFNINPPGTAPTNTAYTAAAAQMSDVLIFQKSDVKRPNTSNNATIEKVTVGNFHKYLKNTANVDWRIEKVGGVDVFRIEHFSYFEQAQLVSLDLTAPQWSRWIERRKNYAYQSSGNPGVERFYWMETVSANFEGENIIYGGACSNPGKPLDYNNNKVTTDLAFTQTQPDRVSDQGFFFMACEPYGASGHAIIEGAIPLLSGSHFNAPFSFRSLHFNYWRHGRYAFTGKMNDTATTFLSTVKQKEQEVLNVPGFSLTDFENWDFSGLTRTQFGDGDTFGEYEAISGVLTLNLVF